MSTQMNQKIADYFKTQPIVKAWLFGSFARGEDGTLRPRVRESVNQDRKLIYERELFIAGSRRE